MDKTWPNQSAAANRRPAGQPAGSDNLLVPQARDSNRRPFGLSRRSLGEGGWPPLLRLGSLNRATSMRLGIGLCVLLASGGCVYNAVRMETRTLPERNPTVYQFELPLEELRARVMAGLTSDKQFKSPIFGRTKSGGLALLHAREAKDVSWVKVLQLPGNDRDLYLDGSTDPLWKSPVYRGPDKGLPFLAAFHVHFAATTPTLTSVSVTALNTGVLNGEMTGMPGHGRARREVRVEPTSIEEYVVLRYIGSILDVRSMPKVILPAP